MTIYFFFFRGLVPFTSLALSLSPAQAGGMADLFPDHMWDIFGIGQLGDAEHGITGDEGQRAHDLFMADISGILSKVLVALKHLCQSVFRASRNSRMLIRALDERAFFRSGLL